MRVVVLDDYQQAVESSAPWNGLADAEVVFQSRHLEGDELLAALDGADAVVAIRERTALPAALLERLPDLRLIVTTGMQNAAIDVAAARARGIEVCGTGQLAAPPAELAWALILAVLRDVPSADADMRAGRWQTTVGGTLDGATLGIAGLGRLGARVASVGLAFGMHVIAWSQNLDPARARSLGVEPVDRLELLRRSDVLSIHLRLSERTRGMIGAAELREMKADAILVNTSRGPIVDEEALVAALREGRIGGAGLDVYDREPLPEDHPLRHVPRTVLTPHLGYVTREGYALCFSEAVEDIVAWRAGAPIRRLGKEE